MWILYYNIVRFLDMMIAAFRKLVKEKETDIIAKLLLRLKRIKIQFINN